MAQEHDEWTLTADLARLKLDEQEARILAVEAERMRHLFLSMARVDVEDLEPTTHALSQGNRVRDDRPNPFESVDELIAASPESEDTFFLIPNVL